MALSDDQRAMLRLLAQREQGYEDIAALMGLSVDQVRDKVKDALAQLEEEGVAAPALPPEPPAPDPVPPPAPEPPVAPAPSAAETPAVPVAPTPPTPPAAAPAQQAPKAPRPKPSLPSGNGARAAIAAAVAAVVVVVLLLVFTGGDSDSGDSTSATNSPAAEETTGSDGETVASREPTEATLEAVDGSDASGTALFGRVKNSLALGIEADSLEPNPKGSVYMIWLAQSPQQMLPLTALEVPKSGRINAQYEVPTEAVVYLASGEFDKLVLTRADNAQLRASLEKANETKRVPAYTGTPVLEGEVVGPIVGAQARLEERKAEESE